MSEPVIEVYTQPGCPYCVRAIDLLNSKKIVFKEIDAPRGSSERKEAIYRSGGKQTVPQIFINDQSLGGCDDIMQLEREGKLDALLSGGEG